MPGVGSTNRYKYEHLAALGTGIATKDGVCGCDWYKQEQRGDETW